MEMEIMEKQFGEKLAKYEVAPPADMWHKISDRLDRNEVLMDLTPKAKTVWFTRERLLRVAAAITFLVGVESVIHYSYKEDNEATVATNTPATEETSQQNTIPEMTVSEPAAFKTTVAQVEKTAPTAEKASLKVETPIVHETLAQEEIIVAPIPQVAIVETPHKEQAVATTITKDEHNSTSISSNTVPVYSLKLLDKDVPANDEITIIDPKVKKIIIIEKGIEKPKIDYSTPKRF